MTVGYLVGLACLAVTSLLFAWSLFAVTPCTCPAWDCPKHGEGS